MSEHVAWANTARAAPGRFIWACRLATLAVFASAAVFYVAASLHWRITVDSAVMHYVVFLIKHGRAPYVQISDNNMPGAYFVEALGMFLFGPGDLAWRVFEFTVLALLSAALIDIARRWDPFAGVFAAGLFIVIHSAEGAAYAAERELTLTALLVIGLALLFRAVEQDRPWLMGLFGLVTGLAASIKPTCLPLIFAALALGCLMLRRRKASFWSAFAYATAALALVLLLDLAFLLHFHALGPFRFILQHVLPAYVAMGAAVPLGQLVITSFPRILGPLLLVVPVAAFANLRSGRKWTWQHGTLLLAAAFGLFSYLIQHKGFLHHRYTFELFVFLLLGIEIFEALRKPGYARVIAAAALTYVLLFAVPHVVKATGKNAGHSDLELALEADLQQLGGGQRLQDQVQCFDLVYGCLDALYHLRIVENASFTGDLLFFPLQENQATTYYRDRFWKGIAQNPPEVIVLTNQNLARLNGFDKVERWPAFNRWLVQNYTPVVERHFTFEHFGGRFEKSVEPPEQDAYRIYLRNASPLLTQATALASHRAPGQS